MTEKVYLLEPPGGIFDETVLTNLFPEKSIGALRTMVHRAVDKGEISRLKPGLFCLAEPFRKTHLHPFALAGILHSPSHVSLESALAHHALLPEAVYQVASVTSARSRTYRTPLGTFSFQRVVADDPRAGVVAHRLDRISWAFIATPLRAIADLVYLRKQVRWSTDRLAFLVESLRIEPDDLAMISMDPFDQVYASVRNNRVRAYLEGLRKELGND